MSVTIVEKHQVNKRSTICIRPFFEAEKENMGLEKYNLSLFDGIFHEEPLCCLEINGIKRYVTGLNEFAPEVRALGPDEQEAKIKQIRTIVSELEKQLAANVVEPTDPDFWNKVTLLRPNNSEFWDKITIRCGNDPVFLEPANDPYDLIKLTSIEAGGFFMVAKSLEEAKKRSIAPKFYLDKLEQTASTNTEVKKLRNKAGSELQKLYDKNANKLFYVAKVIDANSTQYRKSTPNDIMYENMDQYIDGKTVEKNKRATAQRFIEVAGLDMETLKIRALVKDATFYKVIAPKADGFIYHLDSSSMMGRTPADVLEFLRNPLHEDVLADVTKKIERFWNQ